MKISLTPATTKDAKAIAQLRTATNERLTRDFGKGPWSSKVSEKGVLYALRISRVFIVQDNQTIIGTFQLATKKPWSIDKSYFADSRKPLYLTAMAVEPDRQRGGIGRGMLEQVKTIARKWSGDAIRLDAYDLKGGAGEFYSKCGYQERGRATYRGTPLIYYELLI